MSPLECARRLPFAISPDEIGAMRRRAEIPGAIKVRQRWVLPPSATRWVAARLRAGRAGAGREGR